MDFYLGIDGTGPSNNDEYRREFTTSFVQKIYKTWPANQAFYICGPSLSGGETMNLVDTGTRQVTGMLKEIKARNAPYRVFLAGYSRGGAAATETANRLKSLNIKVHCLLLFDAVDRSNLANADEVPSNVVMCYHARRDRAAGSRESFGNCATRAATGVAYTEKSFFGTHGAIGGTPWSVAGASGKIEELSSGHKISAVGMGFIVGGAAGAMQAKRAADNHDFTNVTLAQEKTAAAAVWDWMSGNLNLAKSPAMAGGDMPLGAAGKSMMA